MKLFIEKSIVIDQPASKVYGIISDLQQWNTWSPWAHSEPTAKIHREGQPQKPGQSQSWDGEVIGSGKMTVLGLEQNKMANMKLEFFKPWKSEANVQFVLTQKSPTQCGVTWKMDSDMPFFMIFFKKMMAAFIGNDFERGLRMLKEYAETGKVVSQSKYQGEKDFSGFQIIGIRNVCKIENVGESVHGDFKKIEEALKKHLLPTPEETLCLYNKFDIPNGICEYTAACAYKKGENIKVPEGFTSMQFSDHKALLVDHYGPYRNLGNPWSMIMSYQRGKKKKPLKSVPMYEIYKTMPDGRPENNIYTQIILPIK